MQSQYVPLAQHPDQDALVTAHALGHIFAGRQDATDHEMACTHSKCSVHEQSAAAGFVNVEKRSPR